MKIGKELALIAKKKGICQEWFDQMKTLDDKDRLLEMYVRGIDFCLSNDFPTNDYIRENFVGRMEEYGVHLDESLNTAPMIAGLSPLAVVLAGLKSTILVYLKSL